MKRKTSALLLSAVMTLGMTPYAFAGDITTNEQVVATSESKEVQTSGTSADGNISYVLYKDKSLVFSGTGTLDFATVHGVVGYSSVTSVVIESGITGIDNDTFVSCSSLTSVSIPEGVTGIGQMAFYGCRKLTKVSIPSSVTNIGEIAFGFCSQLKSVEIAEGLTTIPREMFLGCSNLESVTMPKSVTKIEETAFGEVYPVNLVIQYAGTEKDWKSIDIVNSSNGWWYDENTTAQVIYNGQEECNHSYTYNLVDSVKWSDDYKSATVEFVCQTCGDKQLVDADVTTKTMAPTCTDQGVTTATAKAVLKDENGKTLQSATTSVVTAVTPALGHAWSEEGTVTKNATCAEEGERTYACTHEGCDEAKTESIGKLTPAVDAQRATDLSIWDRLCNRKKITVTSSIVNYEYAAVENGQVGDITARGIVYAATEDLGSDELVIGANGSEAFAVPSGYTEDTYDWDITVKSKSTQYTVRSWVQYTDSNGEFAYAFSDPITVSYNGL